MQAKNRLMMNRGVIEMTKRYVGIVAAPGAPDALAKKIKKDLPDILAEHFEEDYEWEVEVFVDPLTNYAELTKELFQKTEKYYSENDWDYTMFITDLPIYHNDHITVIDLNEKTEVGVVSLPAYGWPPNKKGILDTIVTLITSVQADNDRDEAARDDTGRDSLVSAFSPYFKTSRLHYDSDYREETGSEHSIYQIDDNLRGYLRLVSGMSWANNPFNMLRILSGVVALAFATGAFSMMFSTMWNLSNIFSTWRLLAVSLLAVTGMVTWIIISHNLWETREQEADIRFLKLYNGATLLTLLISLVFYFIVLYLMFLTAGLVLLPPDYILRNIGEEEVGIRFYLELAWFATSLSTVVASIGASVQDKSIIQESTYGYRHRFRLQNKEKD
ncbi:hypothetical protein SAMN05216235_0124 [Salinicoccus halodurans]|uniref:5,10-methylene-tetrahydrofolate dehydrogenase n=2 Tax=Salinicoccus halodurans TaxID=407035 RepID=A0AA94HBJ7_9STAP|nr:hypothetical protein SAMN05216235_0124 [Salinicoccus halodurans]